MKKTPVILMLLITTLFFTVLGAIGSGNIYSLQRQDYWTTPFLSRVFTGINDGIYPWDIFVREKREALRAQGIEEEQRKEYLLAKSVADNQPGEQEEEQLRGMFGIDESASTPIVSTEPIPTSAKEALPTPAPTATASYTPRYEPLRESTYEEYINHISADIYGTEGVEFASEFEFRKVDIDYFDDALFIGDSRTVGLYDYTDLRDHADFLCETSLTVWKVFESDFRGAGTVEEHLFDKEYGKIYLTVGVNELGRGTTEDYLAEYTKVIDRLHELEPEAKIFIQAIMNIDRERSDSDDIFNNTNILGRNRAIATLADNETFFYIDCNPFVCDEDGYLRDDIRGDHLHLLGAYNEIIRQFLMEHGV